MGTCYLMKGRENAAKPYRAEWYDYFSKPGKRVIGGRKTFANEREQPLVAGAGARQRSVLR